MTKPKRHKGFTLIETMLSLSIFMIIMAGVYMLVIHYASATRTEQSRVRLNQEVRFMANVFASELKDMGTVFAVLRNPSIYGKTPHWRGLTPLNQTTFPDGIIVASGDADAIARLTNPFTPGNSTIVVQGDENEPGLLVKAYDSSKQDFENETLDWRAGDIAAVVNNKGYYIFEVTGADVSTHTLTLRATPVYFSGLLNTTTGVDTTHTYADIEAEPGNLVNYEEGSAVFRLTNFSIYLFKEVLDTTHGKDIIIRRMLRFTDTKGEANILADNTTADYSIISENIWEFQISYVAYDNFDTVNRTTIPSNDHHYFAGGISSSNLAALNIDIRLLALKQLNIKFVSTSDEFGDSGQTAKGATGNLDDSQRVLPRLYDRPSHLVEERKFRFRVYEINVEPRNFSNVFDKPY